MKINKADIHYLKEQLLNTHPGSCSAHLKLGHDEYIRGFISNLQTWLHLYNSMDYEEAEFEISKEECSIADLGRLILNLAERNEFLKGAEIAEKICFECLHSYLDKRPTKPAA